MGLTLEPINKRGYEKGKSSYEIYEY